MSGDTPDYFCSEKSNRVYLAEAKGRLSSINFNTKTFNNWRRQFSRINVSDKDGNIFSVKGFIVASRLLTENSYPNVLPHILIEDPKTEGNRPIEDSNENTQLSRIIVKSHYATILDRLHLRLYASTLRASTELQETFGINVGVWKCNVPFLKDYKFVGGYLTENYPKTYIRRPYFNYANNLDLSTPPTSFFGLEYNLFKSLRQLISKGWNDKIQINPFGNKSNQFELLSIKDDGTILAPLDYFEFLDYERI